MKKMFSIAALFAAFTMFLVAAPTVHTKAQSTYKTTGTDTTVNTDTTILYLYSTTLNVPSKVRGIQATTKGISGTGGGYVLLQGTLDGTVWKDVNTDTLTVSSQTSGVYSSKIWPVLTSSGTSYARYRLWYKTTGTQTSIIIGTLLRRSDE